jgi:hypothetical protein
MALMMEALRSSEMMVNSYRSTRRYNPEDSHLGLYRCAMRPVTKLKESFIRSLRNSLGCVI